MLKYLSAFILITAFTTKLVSQVPNDSSTVNKKLLKGVIISESLIATASLAGLYTIWYADYPKSSFHTFNDNSEWLQMDKIGHATTAYHVGRMEYQLLRWIGVSDKKAIFYGGSVGFVYLSTVEVFDGFSQKWGFSWGDIAANTTGAALFIGQQLLWDEQRIMLKWSYHHSQYSQYRPNVLGDSFHVRMLKDYNGQTYWLSMNIHSFLKQDSRFPKYLNIAMGYSGDGMLGGFSNPKTVDGVPVPHFERNRQYLLSLDLDLTKIETKSKTLNYLFDAFGIIKFPFPAVEYNTQGNWLLHGIYF